MHAWVEAFLPGSGWVGVDPTHGLLTDHHYVKVGVGHDYEEVPPTRGLYRGRPEHTLTSRVHVSVLAQAEEGWRAAGPAAHRALQTAHQSAATGGYLRANGRSVLAPAARLLSSTG
jgi:hypothetical protein